VGPESRRQGRSKGLEWGRGWSWKRRGLAATWLVEKIGIEAG